MMRSFYQGIAGMKAMSDGLSVSGNNIANSRTSGYKARQAMFEDLYYQQYKAATSPNGQYSGINPTELGNGARMKGVAIDHSQGSVFFTGRSTDLAISGEGYFVVGDVNGQNKLYTRDGSFELSSDNSLVTTGGQYVLGWNADPNTGKINTGAGVSPIKINLNQVSDPVESTSAKVAGNLNATDETGKVIGTQIATYDSLGAKHDLDVNFIKTNKAPNVYTYIISPADDFVKSNSIERAVFQPSGEIANSVKKGEYTISTAAGTVAGTVDITLRDPDGNAVLTKNVSDNDQKVTLNDGKNDWFTISYKSGGAPSVAKFQVAEVGTIEYNNSGQISKATGNGPNGTAKVDFVPQTTGQAMSINVDFSALTGVAADSKLSVTESDGFPAATLRGYNIGDRGLIYGYFSDGSIKQIGQVAVSTFANPSGLQAQGENLYNVSASSGEPEIGASGLGNKGTIKAGSLESSNVDISKELTELMFYQKAYTANSKNIRVSDEISNVAIGLIR
ncbi:flagellar hook protein FlgE [Bacillus cereus]|uniref:flagellar hook protein FlgE n=1 Tax=Bacillus cereus TaxID=1396 RepID=UPI000B4C07B9|nr:flagellar hook protein FlgE [Bacillus cereus]